jgi:hypothetical protein
MTLFYAMGGGMGHVYRIWVFIQHFKITNYKIICSNPLVRKLFTEEQIIFLDPDPYEASWEKFVQDTLPTLNVSALYVDTFPGGIVGELSGLSFNFPVFYVARRIRWQHYQDLIEDFNVSFSKVYLLEPLESTHEAFIHQHSVQSEPLYLNYPDGSVKSIPTELIPVQKPLWLIVHAFDTEETEALLRYAKDVASITQSNPYVVVLSDQPIEVHEGTCLSYFPAVDWFPLAEKIFTAGGFNTVQQALPYLDKVVFMPFPRKFDDQAWRINFVKSSKTNLNH